MLIFKFAGKMEDELRYELKKQQTLNKIAYDRIDELHDTLYKMEQRINAMAQELRAVRNFSIDIVNDFGKHFKHVINRKFELDIQAAQDCHDELQAGYEEGIEWMEECLQNEDSDALWKIILEE
jgi:ferritin-like protein